MHDFEDLQARFADILSTCVAERGFETPLYVAVVARNGSIDFYKVYKVHGDSQPLLLAQHHAGGRFMLPVNIMVTDSTGLKAAHARIESPGAKPRWTH